VAYGGGCDEEALGLRGVECRFSCFLRSFCRPQPTGGGRLVAARSLISAWGDLACLWPRTRLRWRLYEIAGGMPRPGARVATIAGQCGDARRRSRIVAVPAKPTLASGVCISPQDDAIRSNPLLSAAIRSNPQLCYCYRERPRYSTIQKHLQPRRGRDWMLTTAPRFCTGLHHTTAPARASRISVAITAQALRSRAETAHITESASN
jgi:hypothetical protein